MYVYIRIYIYTYILYGIHNYSWRPFLEIHENSCIIMIYDIYIYIYDPVDPDKSVISYVWKKNESNSPVRHLNFSGLGSSGKTRA